MRTRTIFLTVIGILAVVAPLVVFAKNGTVVVSADEKVEGDLLRAGRMVRILAPVDGDVIVIGGTVEVAGPVTGDVIAVGADVRVRSDVAGSVRVLGGTVEITGTVGRSVLAAGRQVVMGETAEVGWSITVASADFVFRGRAGRDVRAWSESSLIAGEVGRDLILFATAEDGLTLERTALIQGDFDYTAADPAVVREGAVVKGKTSQHQLPEQSWRAATVGQALAKLIRLFGLIVVGLVLMSLVPKAMDAMSAQEQVWKWSSLGVGFLWTALTPIAAIVLLFTIIGVPFTLILAASWAIGVYFSQIIIALFFGRMLFRYVFKSEERAPKFMDLVFGALVWVILISIPFFGWFVYLVGILLGMGSLVAFKRQELARFR